MDPIAQNIDSINTLCLKHKVYKLFLFGSLSSGIFTEESDIDLLVVFKKIDPEEYADNYFDFKFSLEDLLKRDVDLLEEQAIKNPYLKRSIDSSKRVIYG